MTSIAPLPLLFVRHGETDWNVDSRLQGRTDIPLNARGRDQAAAVGRALAAAFPDIADKAFVASPLLRAQETMRLMREAIGLDPQDYGLDPRLAEMSFGTWEGSTFREIRARQPREMLARDAERWTHRPPDGESYADLTLRVEDALRALTRPSVLVSHGGVARAVLGLVAGAPHEKLPAMHIKQGRAILFDQSGWRWI
ncbi:MAG TPA: histidine phosphatase family protein [Hansschlegelia sp.]